MGQLGGRSVLRVAATEISTKSVRSVDVRFGS
jgi:hypothetical protein